MNTPNINIAGLTPVDDPSYRYKMPRLQAKVEGRGNGIKTVLVNVVEIGLSLNREAPEITKFFGCELGSQTTYAADTDRAIVNGSHTERDLQNHLCRYIEHFVLCKSCKLPETYYKIKGGIISQKCNACGNKDSVDMTHKLTTFILAQHKKAKESAAKADKKEKKKSKSAGEEDVGAEKKKKDKKEKGDESARSPKPDDEVEGDVDGDDNSGNEFAVAENVAMPAIREADEVEIPAIDEAIDRFKVWYAENGSATPSVIMDELRIIQTFGSLRVHDRVIIFLGAVCTESLVSGAEIRKHKDVLSLWSTSPPLQRHLIAGCEWLCGSRLPNLAKLFPVVLKTLFDEELVEEDVFFAWHTDYARNEYSPDVSLTSIEVLETLRASSAPFITWLQEAEVEGEEEDEDEED